MTGKNNIQKGWLMLLLLICFSVTYGQEIDVNVSNVPLNQVLIGLRDRYELRVSFDDRLLSTFPVSARQSFPDPEKAFDFLLQGLPLKYEKTGEVYVFYADIPVPVERRYLLAGQFTDALNQETLPFTHVQINGKGTVSDLKGRFSFVSATDSLFRLKASYLGYYELDTTVSYSNSHHFRLTPSKVQLKEIRILAAAVNRSLQAGYSPGVLRLNNQISGFLPGYGDHSVFNLLRLQPGILAAGEQSNDLVIWGSYEGQSQVLFDGIALFGMKNFNDNISAVNPFMAKDIQVFKGGFGAEHGEKVGGLVNITGIDGNPDATNVKMSINNMTLNGLVSVPVEKRAALVMSMRQTYYGLYDPETFAASGRGSGNGNGQQGNGYTVYPDYNFRDFNLKFSGTTKRSDSYSVSALLGKDRYAYSMFSERARVTVRNESDEENTQGGVSAFYGRRWKSGNTSNLTIAWSGLHKEVGEFSEVKRSAGKQAGIYAAGQVSMNEISEFSGKLENYLALGGGNRLHIGAGAYQNMVVFKEDSFQFRRVDARETGFRWMGFLNGRLLWRRALILNAGLRSEYTVDPGKIYLQPRISAIWILHESFRINGAWGLYNQFVVRSSAVDELGNYRYRWVICNNEKIPVLDSEHRVGGLTFSRGKLTLSLEGYAKKTDGLTRFVSDADQKAIFQGESRSKGLDFFAQKEYKGHLFWFAYSLNKTEEWFPYFPDSEYQRALHDQRHELKCAGVLDFDPVFVSATWISGSGFPDPSTIDQENVYEHRYNRLDAAFIYRFGFRKFELEAGLSVLNIFNSENIKYADFVRIPEEQDLTLNIQAGAIPFTPNLFLNFSF